jgi:hypothetical protein
MPTCRNTPNCGLQLHPSQCKRTSVYTYLQKAIKMYLCCFWRMISNVRLLLLTACKHTVQFKLNNGRQAGEANSLFPYRPIVALIGYGASVCVESGPEQDRHVFWGGRFYAVSIKLPKCTVALPQSNFHKYLTLHVLLKHSRKV